MEDNLFLASEGFGEDDLFTILTKIRNNLDSENCSMTDQYYVLRKKDCPPGSIISNVIYENSGTKNCYVIPSISVGSLAKYTPSGCDNNYINKAINFIKGLDELLFERIYLMKTAYTEYTTTFESLKEEINSLLETLKNSNTKINNYLFEVTKI